ncbi:MAG TPA: GWxTD domain-containing protein, partial [Thermoanaerobaculia bacterium]|nr:GWxTD domain-containing protein [Thermoanaerobaculia bacterium]
MKARIPLLLVFAATLSFQGSATALAVNTEAPDVVPTPVPTPQAAPPTTAPPPAAATPASSAPAHVSQLSKSEAAARLKALPEEERQWLEYVAPIILPDERNLFLQLEAHQYEGFKKDFWARREQQGLPLPLGPGYRNRYDSYRDLAATTYGGLKSDTGKMVILHGEPQSVQEYPNCSNVFRDIAVWTYFKQSASGLHSDIKYLFYRMNPSAGSWKLWMPMMPDSELLAPSSCLPNIAAACRQAGMPAGPSLSSPTSFCPNNAAPQTCEQACEVVAAIQSIRLEGDGFVAAAIAEPPKVEVEGLEKLAEQYPQVGDSKAKALSVQGPSGDAVVPTSPSAKATDKSADKTADNSGPAPAHRKLSKSEIHKLTEALPPQYRDFLTLVELIITPDEREIFLEINENYQRDKFIDNFWRRRTIDSMGIRTDYRAVYTRRVQQAIDQFGDLHNDRAKMFVLNGPPDAVIPIDCDDVYVPIQIWYYERLEVMKSKAYLIFYEAYSMPPYKLWLPMDGVKMLLVGGGDLPMPGMPVIRRNPANCLDNKAITDAIAYTTQLLGAGPFGMASQGMLFKPPVVETEGVDQTLSMTTDLHQGSTDLAVAKLVRF